MSAVALPEDAPLLLGRPTDRQLTERLIDPVERTSRAHAALLWLTGLGTLGLVGLVTYSVLTGVGTWGNRIPIAWGFPIINFVWWIGIGHAGTFISAILLLLRQKWRTSINRIAESMTIFALVQAALFPVLHLGRPWFAYWLVPYPSTMDVWPQFMSVLTWDAAAVFTYTVVSVLFWYLGLLPDLATLRDRARGAVRRWTYGVLSLGWRGSSAQWRHHRSAQLLLAGLATPLVLSVHSIVSLDFATALLPGWHSPIFPPYFVAGAIFSGFAMVLTIVIPVRRLFHLDAVITERHLDLMAKMTLAMGMIVAFAYAAEHFTAWYSGEHVERRMFFHTRPFGPYGPAWWTMMVCNVGVIQALWWRRVRTSPVPLFVVSVLVNVGMWTERFVLVVTSQHRDFLVSSWDVYLPSPVDVGIFLGTLSFFAFLVLLMLRWVPFVPVAELREVAHEERADEARADEARAREGAAAGPGDDARPAEGAPPPPPRPPGPVDEPVRGLLAAFDDAPALVRAVAVLRRERLVRLEAYGPRPDDAVLEALGPPQGAIPRAVLAGAALGGAAAYALVWWTQVVDYPLNVGGRPLHAWPAYLPIAFETAILFGALAGFAAFLRRAGLPRLWHPVMESDGFGRATTDRWLLAVDADDPAFDEARARAWLEAGAARAVVPLGREVAG